MATIKKPLLDEDAEIIGKILFPMAPADQATRQGESWLQSKLWLAGSGKALKPQQRVTPCAS